MKKLLSFLMVALLGLFLVACGSESTGTEEQTKEQTSETSESSDEGTAAVDLSRIRVLIGSTSTGGDTYQIADLISRNIAETLDTNIKVDAVGSERAFNELAKAKNDGSEVMVFHDMAYLGVEYGSFDEKNALENWTIGPVFATNPGNAFLTSADAPYNTMAEAAEWLKNNPSEELSVAIEAGGVSQIGFDGFYLWVKEQYGTEVSDRIKVYVTGSQKDKDQALWDGNVDIIHGSIGANNEYTKDEVDSKIKMKFLGLTAGDRVEGYDIPTFAEQGITVNGKEFVFDKEFFFILPKDIDQTFLTALDQAVAKAAETDGYQNDLLKNAYMANYKPQAESVDYLLEKRDTLRYIIQNAPKLDDIAK
ncbi:tripartite tricarboxylate transporter substrate-binding protein [Bacillus sp. Marseille-P3661]|uniref:tripartite tricarboxylate transporter substrate-binding protein n=1 Tax=Bacillus sp. Marseille-P3661 TaxID=1936234 RepID=UPI000C85D2C0|nr:tripartite tricarboxylate transporter substrate-binding protein [Bacillus sp. Marseille-P3661]